MKTIIENAKTTFFTSKTDYMTFRSNWSEFFNSAKAKPVYQWWNAEKTCGGNKISQLDSAHHLLYLALCGKDYKFTAPKSAEKLFNDRHTGDAFERSLRSLKYAATMGNTEFLFAPFGGTVTLEMLKAVIVELEANKNA